MASIKLIISDFDQVLASLGEAHYLSLNQALAIIDPKFCISEEDRISRFEGLTTRTKPNILIKERGFPQDKADEVFALKQELTAKAIEDTLVYDPLLVSTFSKLNEEGFLLYVASNAIRQTIVSGLTKLGIIHLFDKIYANEDVQFSKPHPQIYLKAIMEAGVSPNETAILEDSKNGREAAVRSGAHVIDLDSPSETTYENIKQAISKIDKPSLPKWSAKRSLNVLLGYNNDYNCIPYTGRVYDA